MIVIKVCMYGVCGILGRYLNGEMWGSSLEENQRKAKRFATRQEAEKYFKEWQESGFPTVRLYKGFAVTLRPKIYMVKSGVYYADGGREWTKNQSKAFRFRDSDRHHVSAKVWAQNHAETFPRGRIRARVVRLVKRASK